MILISNSNNNSSNKGIICKVHFSHQRCYNVKKKILLYYKTERTLIRDRNQSRSLQNKTHIFIYRCCQNITGHRLTAKVCASPVDTESSLSAEMCIGGNYITDVCLLTCFLLAAQNERHDGNMCVTGGEHLGAQHLTRPRRSVHTHWGMPRDTHTVAARYHPIGDEKS